MEQNEKEEILKKNHNDTNIVIRKEDLEKILRNEKALLKRIHRDRLTYVVLFVSMLIYIHCKVGVLGDILGDFMNSFMSVLMVFLMHG